MRCKHCSRVLEVDWIYPVCYYCMCLYTHLNNSELDTIYDSSPKGGD